MATKLATFASMIVGASMISAFGMSSSAEAAFLSCSGTTDTGTNWDISNKVTNSDACTILAPLDGNANDVPPPPPSFVNQEQFFGFNDWLFDAKYLENPSPTLVSFTGDVQSGTWSISSGNQTLYDFMFVFKDGAGTNLVGYLIETATSGLYSSPFVSPPFAVNETKDISHISVYYRRIAEQNGGGGGGQVPEPGTLALMGGALFGLWAVRRRKEV